MHRRPLKACARWWPVALIAGQLWCALRAAAAFRRLPELAPPSGRDALPPVSIVVPARNEAANLPALLPSLGSLDYPTLEVIVVDDGSSDGTAGIAASFGAGVVAAGDLPSGWAGKPHACLVGARAALHPWILFTDADTVHAPASLAAVMSRIRDDNLEAVSLFCGQRCLSFWERLLIPYAYRHFFAGVNARAVNDPRARSALANGQYILISLGAYTRIGGHEAVANSIVEYVALASVFKREGIRYQMFRAGDLVEVRMYRGLSDIRAGFTKNSSRFLAQDPRRGAVVLLSTLLDSVPLSLLVAGVVTRRRGRLAMGICSWAIAALGLAPWMGWFNVPRQHAALQPLAAAAFQLIALEGLRALRPGSTEWKGRRY
jgi:chlorobactene glucosyltransferase